MRKIRTSAEFVEILENYLKEKKISRRQFCAMVNIPPSTVATWKSKNILPSIELVAKVAAFMNVSLDWLVYGDVVESDVSSEQLQRDEIRQQIISETVFQEKEDKIMSIYDDKLRAETEKNITKNKTFLSNVETLVDERGISKQAFCDTLGFSRSSFINWKKQNSLPNADTVIKIANFFKVDPKWLITGNIDLPEDIKAWPQSIFERVYHMLLEETGIPNPEYNEVSLEQQGKIWEPVAEIVSCFDLYNWQFNRVIPSYFQIERLAEHFHKSLSYIAKGIDDSIPDYIETLKVPKEEYDNYKNYEKYKSLFWAFDSIPLEQDKNYVSQLTKRFSEGSRKCSVH